MKPHFDFQMTDVSVRENTLANSELSSRILLAGTTFASPDSKLKRACHAHINPVHLWALIALYKDCKKHKITVKVASKAALAQHM
jgi:hypothetical protein